jgi:hypothetical protein
MRNDRIVLPAVMGLVSAVLMAWEYYNSKVIAPMGMGWDTGAPMWPYQTPEIFLKLLNAPAYLLAAPIWFAFDLRMHEQRQPVLMVAIVVSWLGLVRMTGLGVWSRARRRGRAAFVVGLLLSVVVFSFAGVALIASSLAWWSYYGDWSLPSALIFARIAAVAPWSFVLALASVRAFLRFWLIAESDDVTQ